MEKGLLIVISGPAGSGKGTVDARLLQSDEYAFSVSATTRAPRPGEINGKNYHFITREEFERRIRDGEMLEYTTYCGNYYGTPLKETTEALESGRNLILEIDVTGAKNVKKIYPDAVLIMFLPPSFAVQEARLRGRGTESEDIILARLEHTRTELPQIDAFDYVVYNYDHGEDRCADDIRSIVRAEKCAVRRHKDAATSYFGD